MEGKRICGIYKIISPSGKVYIGQTCDIEKRWNKYKYFHCKAQPHLYNSLIKYGVDKHSFSILHECSEGDLDKLELHYIKEYDCFSSAKGMNLRSGGGGGHKLSEESKRKSGEKQKLNWIKRKAEGRDKQSKESVRKRMEAVKATRQRKLERGEAAFRQSVESNEARRIFMKAYFEVKKNESEYYSEEQKLKRSQDAKRGVLTRMKNGTNKCSESAKEKMQQRMSGSKNPFYGKHHSDETWEKIKNSARLTWARKKEEGYKQSEEHIAKRVRKQLGQKRNWNY